MIVVFDASVCGLGNNGGSRTILKCCESLRKIGCEAYVYASVNNFSWFPSRHLVCKRYPKNTDISVSVSYSDVKSCMSSNAKKKFWYIRGYETWHSNEKKLIERYNIKDLNLITNSNGLKERMLRSGVNKKINVVHQGIDIKEWKDFSLKNKKKSIGVLYSSRKSKRFSDFTKLIKKLNKEDYLFYSYSSEKLGNEYSGIFDEFIRNPSQKQLLDLYNKCDIWFCPTETEGLHNPPMEAALCGSLIVCSDNLNNGMVRDYAFDNTAMIYSNLNEAYEFIKKPNFELVDNMKKYIKENIGSREKNMKKMMRLFSK